MGFVFIFTNNCSFCPAHRNLALPISESINEAVIYINKGFVFVNGTFIYINGAFVYRICLTSEMIA